MESWRHIYRVGLAPLLSTEHLEALRQALTNDDPRLLQGATTSPPPLQAVSDWPVEAACVIGYCGAVEHGGFQRNSDGSSNKAAATVAQVEEFFARKCYDIDQRIGEPAACRWFLHWADETPRDEMRKNLLIEVQRTLKDRLTGPLEPAVTVDEECQF